MTPFRSAYTSNVRLRQPRVDLLHFAADRISHGGEKRVSSLIVRALLLHNYILHVCAVRFTSLSCCCFLVKLALVRILINTPLVFSPLYWEKNTRLRAYNQR
jgi:hypothetical protein